MRPVPLSALALLLAACTASGQRLGVTDFRVVADAGEPGLTARLWYPTIGGTEQRFGASRIRPGYLAVPDAKPALPRRAPLIVLNHGSGGSAESMAWLATGLARRGALVIAADHPASSGGNPQRLSILKVWTQPHDVRRLLGRLLASEWGARIDHQRIAAIGFSLGGTAAMSMAGARLQFERFPAFCASHDDGACRAFRRHFASLDGEFFARANVDLSESRLRVAVAIAPGFTEALTAESLRALRTPVMLIVGEKDQQLPPQTHVHPMRHLLPPNSRYLEIAEAQHFSFLPLCGDDARSVLAETDEEFVCEEVGTRSRKQIHAQTLVAIEEFLLANGVLAGPGDPPASPVPLSR